MRGVELAPEHPPARLAELGALAESVGFDAAFASSHYLNRDAFLSLAAVARATDDLRVGPGVANPYETHPVALASRMATLHEVSDGRGVFGVGAGDRSTLADLGLEWERPLRRVLETTTVARRLWAGERVDHDGTFRARDAALAFEPGEIPVYVGAQGPGMLRMSAKHADGVLANVAHPRDVAWAADRIEEGLAERPPDRGEFDFAVYASASVAADGAAAREAARPAVAFVVAGAAPPALERHDLDPAAVDAVRTAVEAGDYGAAADRVTPAMLEAFCVAGPPASIESWLDAVLEHADSVVFASPLGPDPETAIDLAGTALEGAGRHG